MAAAAASLHILINLFDQPAAHSVATIFQHGRVFQSREMPPMRPDAIVDIFFPDADQFSEGNLRRAADEALMEKSERDSLRLTDDERPDVIVVLTPVERWKGRTQHAVDLALEALERLTGFPYRQPEENSIPPGLKPVSAHSNSRTADSNAF